MDPEPIRYTPGLEQIGDDEERLTREIVDQMAASSVCAFQHHRHAIRDAHAKSHAILKGELIVHDDLDAPLRQGIFATPGAHDVVARVSSAPGDIHTDRIPSPRGFALKVMGVAGERLSPDLGGANQDVLMVNFPALAFGTIARYKELLGILEANAHAPEIFQRMVAGVARGAKDAVQALGGTPNATLEGLGRDNHNPLGETYFTQGALRYGDYVAKLSLAPASPAVKALTGQPVTGDSYSMMRDAIEAFFKERSAEYTLRAQLCVDPEKMPVEDASVQWDEALSPFRPIATVRFPRQAPYTPGRQVYGDDVLAFNPWNGVEAHRPLGGIMRIRRAAYERSSTYRHHMNDLRRHEPASDADIPD